MKNSKAHKHRIWQGPYRGHSTEKVVVEEQDREDRQAMLKSRLAAELKKDGGNVEMTAARLARMSGVRQFEIEAMIRRMEVK